MMKTLICLLMALIAARTGSPQDLILEVPSGALHAGIPFVVRVVVEDDETAEARPFPETPGLLPTGPPSTRTSRSTTVVNGRMSHRVTSVFTWELLADAPGFVTVPSLLFETARGLRATEPRTLRIGELDAGDVIDVVVTSDRDRYFVGEPVELRLEIAIRRFDDERFGYMATAEDTFRWIDERGSRFGIFAGDDPRNPPRTTWQEIERPDASGRMVPWYLFVRSVIERPTAAGPLVLPDVTLLVRFPVRLSRRSDLLGRGTLQVAEERLALGRASLPPILMRSPPFEGRPDTFRGAVGLFSFSADALPTNVSVGDPVTLHLRVRDESAIGTRLDLLQAPPIDRNPELLRGFRVPSEPLTGSVEGREKVFTQTIRPLDAEVRNVPPIDFTFFDPESERYVTISSDAIPLSVAPVDRLAIDEILSPPGSPPPESAVRRREGGLHHPDLNAARLAERRDAIGVHPLSIAAGMSLPPIAWAALMLIRRRGRTKEADARWRLSRNAALARASSSACGPAEATDLLLESVCVLAGRPSGTMTGDELLRALRASKAQEALINDLRELLEAAEAARYGGDSAQASMTIPTTRLESLLDRVAAVWSAS